MSNEVLVIFDKRVPPLQKKTLDHKNFRFLLDDNVGISVYLFAESESLLQSNLSSKTTCTFVTLSTSSSLRFFEKRHNFIRKYITDMIYIKKYTKYVGTF